MNTPSDTPRTDARMEYDASDLDCTINFARELERELNAALARAEKAEAQRAANFQSLEICAMHCDDARAEVKRLKEKQQRARQVLEKIVNEARRIYGNTEDKDIELFFEDLIYIISYTTKP
jgi:molecular chaperone GrpE (heat shock protein)